MKLIAAVLGALAFTLLCAPGVGAIPPQSSQVEEVKRVVIEIQNHISAMEIDIAREKIDGLIQKYPVITDSVLFSKLVAEVGVIGREAGKLEVLRWIQGKASFEDSAVTLLVFWESWCPHCQDGMPGVETLYQKFQADGLNVVGATRIMEKATMTSVIGFIVDYKISFPIAKVTQDFASHFGVDGVPAAVLIKHGKVLWRGNPDRINETTIKRSLAD